MKISNIVIAFVFALAVPALGDDAPKTKGSGPCHQIVEQCKGAGFVQGDWKKGDGLWRDCVNPIIQGVTTVPGGTKSLPSVDAKLVADCKAKRPKFGAGKVGSVQDNKK